MAKSVFLKSIVPEAQRDSKVADLICNVCGGISIMTVTKEDLQGAPMYLESTMFRHKQETWDKKTKKNGHNDFTLKWIPLIEERLKERGEF